MIFIFFYTKRHLWQNVRFKDLEMICTIIIIRSIIIRLFSYYDVVFRLQAITWIQTDHINHIRNQFCRIKSLVLPICHGFFSMRRQTLTFNDVESCTLPWLFSNVLCIYRCISSIFSKYLRSSSWRSFLRIRLHSNTVYLFTSVFFETVSILINVYKHV